MVTAAVREELGRYEARGRLESDAPRGAASRPIPSDQRPATSDHPRLATDHPPLSEATLVRLWAGQRYPASALVTRQAVPVLVLHPGRRGRGAGPDFRDAIIATPAGGLLRGDVELHVRASDFRAHGHHRDRHYDGVVLHVVFEDDIGQDTRLAGGREVPVVALASWVRRRGEELASWLAGPELWREPCHDAVARLGREQVLRRLESLGDQRFRERQAALAAALKGQGPGEVLYRALLAGLGYGGDRDLFGVVAERLPWAELSARLVAAPGDERVALAEALLLGAAGLLPSQHGAEPCDPREARWEEQWLPYGGMCRQRPSTSAPPSLRPANHPGRRLAGLAELLMRHGPVLEERAAPDDTLEGPIRQLIEAWVVPAGGYWRRWLAPGVVASRPPGALIGRGRAIELVVNAVLPWAAARAEARVDPAGATRAPACFSRLPRPAAYGALAFLEANLRAEDGPLPLDARRQQGLLGLYKSECSQGGCGRCPLS